MDEEDDVEDDDEDEDGVRSISATMLFAMFDVIQYLKR